MRNMNNVTYNDINSIIGTSISISMDMDMDMNTSSNNNSVIINSVIIKKNKSCWESKWKPGMKFNEPQDTIVK